MINKDKSSTKGNKNFKNEIIQSIISGESYCITFNMNQKIPIWNYMLRDNKTSILVYDEDDTIIYDGLVIEMPNYIFEHGDTFANICFKGIDIEEPIVSRKNFFLFEKQLIEKGVL